MNNPSALELASRLRSARSDSKTVLVQVDDTLYEIANLDEDVDEIVIILGRRVRYA